MHSDPFDIVGHVCMRRGAGDGTGRIVSALALHNEILRCRPDVLGVLYRGYVYASAEGPDKAVSVTSVDVPVFACLDEQVSCMYARRSMEAAAQRLEVALPNELRNALDVLDELAERSSLGLQFRLAPGETLFWNNWTNLHAFGPSERPSESGAAHVNRFEPRHVFEHHWCGAGGTV